MSKEALKWLTPILAAITFLLDGGHMVGLIKPEVLVLIAAAATALVGFIAAIRQPDEEAAKIQQLPHPQAQQQPPQPQKK